MGDMSMFPSECSFNLLSLHPERSQPSYLGIYIGFLLLDLALRWFGYLIYLIGTLRASRIIHKSLVDSVLRTTLR